MKQMIDVLKKMLYILNRPQKILCIMVFLLTMVGSLLECLGVTIIIPMVNLIMEPDVLMDNRYVQRIPLVSSMGYRGLVLLIVGGTIAIYIFKNAYFIFMSWFRIKFSCKIQREISIKMMESYMSRGYQFFLNKDFGELSRGVNGDTSRVYTVINAGFRLFSDFFTIIIVCIFMFITDWSLSLMMVAMSVVCVLLIYFVFRRNMYKAGVQSRIYSAAASQALLQAFSGIKDVYILRKQRHFVDMFEENTIQVQVAQCKSTVGQESPSYIIEGISITGILVVIGMRIVSGSNDAAFIGTLAAFAVGAFRILPSLGRISVSLNSLLNCVSSINAVYCDIQEAEAYAKAHPDMEFKKTEEKGLIDKKGMRKEKSKGKDLKPDDRMADEEKRGRFSNAIELRDITFGYNASFGNVLEHINLVISKGQSIALIGASGAGKSTLVDIILGLLLPSTGGVYMDGVKITDIPELWSKTIGYVPQSVFLSSASILENVAFGEGMNEIDEERAWEALERAELGSFVRGLPEGIMTGTGDRGVRLSGGQRQRIAIARALYHRPDILVLDEATSALDNETETAIMGAIDSLQGQVTMIIVAHRLTTVRNCDIIYEVDNKTIKKRNKEEVLREAGIM